MANLMALIDCSVIICRMKIKCNTFIHESEVFYPQTFTKSGLQSCSQIILLLSFMMIEITQVSCSYLKDVIENGFYNIYSLK